MAPRAEIKGKVTKRWNQGGNVGMRCHLEWLGQVTDLLSADNMSRLRRSCFGPILALAQMKFQGQLYHILLRNHLLADSSDRLRFLIHDKVHEFGLVEFALFIGLKFSGYFEPPQSSEIHRLSFSKKRKLKLKDISAAFKKECKDSGGNSELCLKPTYLILLFGVVVMRAKGDTNIQMEYVHLVDDIEKFNEFPWGRASYDLVVQSTLSRKEVLENQLSQGKKGAYDVYGSILALQVWAYEVIADLGRHCGYRIEGKEHCFPRMLRWIAPGYFQYDDLMRFFPVQPTDRLLPPSDEEWLELESLGLQQGDIHPPCLVSDLVGMTDPERKGRAVDKDARSRKRKWTANPLRRSSRKAVQRPLDSTGQSRPCAVKDSPSDRGKSLEKDTCSNVSLTSIVATVKELLISVRSIETAMHSCPCFLNVHAEAGVKQGPGFRKADYESPHIQTKVDSAMDADVTPTEGGGDGGQKEDIEFVSSVPRKGSCSGTPQPMKSDSPIPISQNPRMYDPMDASFLDVDANQFEAWHDSARMSRIQCETPLLIISQRSVNWDWFNLLKKPWGWLSSEHIDALTNLLLFKYNQNKEGFLSDWTMMEQLGTTLLMKGDSKNVPGTLMDYVLGKLPKEARRPWTEARHVVGIANVNQDHWVCYLINLPHRSIGVYNSTSRSTDWPHLAAQFENMS